MKRSNTEESNRQLREAWKQYAQASPGGESFDRDGLSFANAKQPWFFMNLCLLNRPAADQQDLENRAREAAAYFGISKNAWLLGASEDWLGRNAQQVLSCLDLEFKIYLTGMMAEPLNPPLRPLPLAQLRRINDEETRLALSHLNADAYGVPHEWGRRALGAALSRSNIFGRVAYVGDEPASGAFAFPIDHALYVAWVATAKGFRGLGLAELVIRTCLEDAKKVTHLERTFLHATADGLHLYLRMGYRPLANFPFYGPRQCGAPVSLETAGQ
jgi:GNAT superfamily N-acetyltransferase